VWADASPRCRARIRRARPSRRPRRAAAGSASAAEPAAPPPLRADDEPPANPLGLPGPLAAWHKARAWRVGLSRAALAKVAARSVLDPPLGHFTAR
jgi:hypothetical protein